MLKIVLFFLIAIVFFVANKAYGDQYDDFGTRLIPNKMVENSEGLLQVFLLHNGHLVPKKIDHISFSSTDSSVVQILGVQNTTNFITEVKIKAVNRGDAKVILAAPGFNSKEMPIQIFDDTNSPSQILLKTSPSIFSDTGPKEGYVTVEIANRDSMPVIAKTDVSIDLSTYGNIINLKNKTLIIKTGQYFTVGKFTVEGIGDDDIYASSRYLKTTNSTVSVKTESNPLTIQAYVYPKTISNFAASYAYAVMQLHDSSGNPVLAKEDIPVYVKVTNSSQSELKNTTEQTLVTGPLQPVIIKKGSYWCYAPIVVNAGINGTFNISISAKGYQVSNPVQLSSVPNPYFVDKSARVDLLPILATGGQELIGILHLEDSQKNPIISNNDLRIKIDSSNPSLLSVKDVMMSKGSGAVPVFADVGNIASDSVKLHVVTHDDQIVSPSIKLPQTKLKKLVVEPLLPKIISLTDFPISTYMEDENGRLAYFTDNASIYMTPNAFVNTESQKISNVDSVVILQSHSKETGQSTIEISAGNYHTQSEIESISHIPMSVDLNFPDPSISNFNNTFAIQFFNSDRSPISADNDIPIKLVSSDTSLIKLPQNLIMKKNQYYQTFDALPKGTGDVTISVLSDNLPLSTFQLHIKKLLPELNINAPSTVNQGDSFLSTLSVKNNGEPVSGMNVNWTANGAYIQNMDSITSINGTANILLLPKSTDMVILSAAVNGFDFEKVKTSKTITINSTANLFNSTKTSISPALQNYFKPLEISGTDLLPLLVITGISVGGIFIKRHQLIRMLKTKVPLNFLSKK